MTADVRPIPNLPGSADLIAGLADGTLAVGSLAGYEIAGIVKELMRRNADLEEAIKKHRDQKTDDRCWEDDRILYSVLGDGDLGDSVLPPEHEFLESCRRYWRQRRDPTRHHDLNRTIAQLEAEITRLEAGIRAWNEQWGRIEAERVKAVAERDALLGYLIEPWHHDDGRMTWHVRSTVGAAFDSQDEAKDFVCKAIGFKGGMVHDVEAARLKAEAERDALLRFLIHHPNPTMYIPDRDLTRWGFFEPMGAGGIGVWRDFTTHKEAVDALMECAIKMGLDKAED